MWPGEVTGWRSQQLEANAKENAILVHVELRGDGPWPAEAVMEELNRLAETAGAQVIAELYQRRPSPDPAFFVGPGKVEEIRRLREDKGADLVIFGRELSPAQGRNLEARLNCRVIDRSELIMDIFAQRARTREGKLQVELAQLNYLLPRLAGRGTILSRLGGGIGTRGPGETQLETDRRRIRQRIRDLKRALIEVRKGRQEQRKSRLRSALPLIALVGYTNAGKTTLKFRLTSLYGEVPANNGLVLEGHDRLFDTLDPSVKKIFLVDGGEAFITDTVGFINQLPHHLIAAFRATLEEVTEADLLLHVVDASSPQREEQMQAVEEVLRSLDALQKPTITVFNKVDLVPSGEDQYLLSQPDAVVVSALKGTGLDELARCISVRLADRRVILETEVPYDRADVLSILHEKGHIIEKTYCGTGTQVKVQLDQIWARRVLKSLSEDGTGG